MTRQGRTKFFYSHLQICIAVEPYTFRVTSIKSIVNNIMSLLQPVITLMYASFNYAKHKSATGSWRNWVFFLFFKWRKIDGWAECIPHTALATQCTDPKLDIISSCMMHDGSGQHAHNASGRHTAHSMHSAPTKNYVSMI